MALTFDISDKKLRFRKDAYTHDLIVTEFIGFP